MLSRKLGADLALAMLIALPAVAPAQPNPRSAVEEAAKADDSVSVWAAVADRRREVRANLGEGL